MVGRRIETYLHELLLRAFGADDVLGVGDEALAHEGRLALRADEAVVVPVAVFERNEASAADAWKKEMRRFSIVAVGNCCKILQLEIARFDSQRIV